MTRFYRRFFALTAALLPLTPASTAGAFDVTGHWRDGSGYIRHLLQTGDDVTMAIGPFGFEGTFSGGSLELTTDDVPYEDSYSLVLSPDESTLEGTHQYFTCVVGGFCFVATDGLSMHRCSCFDGNAVNGDGCDVECRVEPCFDCTGDPSTCVPLADATPCEHRSDCIAGGSCNAGLCENGVVDEGCFDLGGSWLRTKYPFEWQGSPGWTSASISEVVQQNGENRIYTRPSTLIDGSAFVDPEAQVIHLDGTATGFPNCGGNSYDAGILAADGRSFSMLGHVVTTGGPGRCISFESFNELAVRCASPGIESSDACRADSCQRCGGDPEICEPVSDGTPCASDDPCAAVSTCNAGECVASISDECPLCMACDGTGGCVTKPRENCRQPADPRSTKLAIKKRDPDSGDGLGWAWKKGAAIQPYDLGRPDLYSGVALCIFDESTATPSLVMSADVREDIDPVYDPPEPNAWKGAPDGSARFSDKSGADDGVVSIRLEPGEAGRGSIKLKARGELVDPPTPELPLPLRAQFQIEGGACFEGHYAAEGVARNANGVFRAKGTP